ncbi:MAG: 1,2-phenylacetyl-CoA epoxidase subunit PaaC [Gammaproteobacteria bacterium]
MTASQSTSQASSQATDIDHYIIRLADDALVLGQRLSEWTSNGPTLEEDIAMSNIALDFLGRARMLYAYTAERTNTTEDALAFLRGVREYTNLLICELPRGDYAFTTVRQYFIDCFDVLYFEALCQSNDNQLAAIAAKTLKESRYHKRRSHDLMVRLGDGTQESKARMQAALNELWGYRHEMFMMDELESSLALKHIAVDRNKLESEWSNQILVCLNEAGLHVPETDWQVSGGRQGVHSEHLGPMLDEMQCLHRSHPGVIW